MSKMISVASGFQYSVNIEYDLADDDKLRNFIPTKAALNLLEEILLSVRPNSSERARILIGAYGRGKSHIVLTILALLMKKDLKLFEKLLPKLKADATLWSLVENFYAGSNKILPVIINGTATNLNQSFLSALQKTLADFGLANLMPETNFQAAIKVLARWRKNFPKTYAVFKNLIREPVSRFVARLENFDVDAYETFEKIYPDLTAGSAFNPFLGFGAVELYDSVAKSLRAKGWSGLFVVYDEFSKFLEANIGSVSVSETKMLQDFAEKANRSGSAQIHLLLISHKEISNYIDTLPKEKVDGWRGVSDRFLHVRMNNDFSQTYELISEVIRHEPTQWKNFLARHADEFKVLCEKCSASDIFRNEPNAVTQIVEGCFPLHPVSTFILPRLSERVAQNERTLFTFLSAEGISTLPTFLNKYRDDFTLITPDKIFDYFAPIFGRELYGDETHKIFLTANKILRKADISSLAAKIVKTLALIYILEQFELLAPTKEQLAEIFSSEYSVNEIARAFDELIEKKFVVYRKQSNNFLKLKETSGVDVRQKIRDMTETLADSVSICDELNAANFNNFMYPAGYNTEREMTRWFAFRFVAAAEIFDEIKFDGDGIIFGVLLDGDDVSEEISRRLLTESRGKLQCLFVLPKKFVDVRDTVKKFAVVRKLKELAEDDPPLFEEYELIFEDLREVIKNFVDAYIRPELFRATYIYDGEILPLYRKAALIGQLSKICDKVFPDTPIINNEVTWRQCFIIFCKKLQSATVSATCEQMSTH